MAKFLSGRNIPQWDKRPSLPPFQENERVQADEYYEYSTGTIEQSGLDCSVVAFDDDEDYGTATVGNTHLTSLGKHWRVGGR